MTACDTSKIIRRLYHVFASLLVWGEDKTRSFRREHEGKNLSFSGYHIAVSVKATKTEVLELAFDNLRRKHYAIDEIARK